MGFCEECGAPLKEEAAFCEHCGTPVSGSQSEKRIKENETEAAEDSVYETLSSSAEKNSEENDGYYEEPPKNPKSKNTGRNLGLVGLLLIAAIGGYLFWSNRGSEGAAPTSETSSLTSETSTTTQESSTTSETLESTTEATVETLENTYSVAGANRITEDALKGATGKFSVVLAPIEENEPGFSSGENQMRRSASVIKLFVMAAVYDQVNQDSLTLNQEYSLAREDIVGGTGVLQNYPVGSVLTINQLLRHMIVDSDNTAGNILIQELGGLSELNRYLKAQDFSNTVMNRLFLDTEALDSGIDNYTSAEDVAKLLQNVYQQEQVSPAHDLAMLELLNQNKNRSKLPAQIGSEVEVYNKTGEYADYGVENDACIFEKDEKAYVLVVLSEDGKSSEQTMAMNRLGKEFYDTFMRGEQE